ncbi:hypothetical protein D3C86_2202490 [compost metagenome]
MFADKCALRSGRGLSMILLAVRLMFNRSLIAGKRSDRFTSSVMVNSSDIDSGSTKSTSLTRL